jgi:hypothetical protein
MAPGESTGIGKRACGKRWRSVSLSDCSEVGGEFGCDIFAVIRLRRESLSQYGAEIGMLDSL